MCWWCSASSSRCSVACAGANRVSPCHSSRTSRARSGRSRRGRRSPSVHCAAPARIDTHPAGTGQLRRRPAGPRRGGPRARAPWTCSGRSACARTSPTASSTTSPPIRTTRGWRSCRAAGSDRGSARRSASCFPTRSRRASLLHLLLDDWVGAALVSGYAVQHAAITLGIEEKLPAGTADNMAGICAGFARGRLARPVRQAQRHHSVGARAGRAAARPATACTPSNRCARTACGGSAGSTSVRRRRSRLRRALPRLARRRRRRGDDRARVHGRGLGGRVDANHHLGHGDGAGAAVAGVPRRHRKRRTRSGG